MFELDKNFSYYLQQTPLDNNLLTEKDVINYLQYINNINFLYNNVSSYDIIDYEKLIFIEIHFSQNQQIQELLADIKRCIATGYVIKKQYINRVFDNISLQNDYDLGENGGYYGIPKQSRI